MLENNHNSEKDRVLADFESAKAKLSESYSNAQRTISKGSKEVKASPMTVLEKQWREQHDDLQSFISESMGEDEQVKRGEKDSLKEFAWCGDILMNRWISLVDHLAV